MNLKLPVIALVACALLRGLPAFSQSNAVQLKSGATLIGSHATIADAYAAIPAPLTQPYIIELTAGYSGAAETTPLTFTAKAGASAANTITVRPAAGVANIDLTVAKSAGTVIVLDDADYLIMDGRPGGTGSTNAITIGNTATASSSNTLSLINGATHNIFRNLNLVNGTSTNTGRNINLGASANNVTGNSDNQFLYCVATGGRYNINSNGTAANPNTRNRFYGCDVVNGSFAGIWYQAGTAQMVIDSCRFYFTSATGDGASAILFDSQRDTVVISQNKIYDINNGTKTSAIRGISIRSVSATGANLTRIHNNFISLTSTNSTSVIGIEYAGSVLTNADIYYNSVRISGALASGGSNGSVGSAAFTKTASNVGSVYNLKNNIFVNERTGGASGLQHLAMALTSAAGTINSDYNTYNSGATSLVRSGTTVYATIADYQAAAAAGTEVNSNSAAVQFVSLNDLHLAGTSIGNAALRAQPIATVTTDIDNQARSASPYRGADETSGTSSIRESVLAQSVSLYPNPAAADLTVDLVTVKNASLTVLDITGKVMAVVPQATGKTNLNTANLKAGTYILKVSTSEGAASKRFVVIH